MSRLPLPRPLVALTALGGLGDALTGPMLLLRPEATLRLMGVTGPVADPGLVRLVGAFVAAVGSGTLLAVLAAVRSGDPAPVRGAWAFTGWIRLHVGLAAAGGAITGSLPGAYGLVAATDLGLAALFLGALALVRPPRP